MLRKKAKVLLLAGLLMASASPAAALGPVVSPDYGAQASSTVATGKIGDIKCDDRAAQGQFVVSGSTQKLNDKSGCYTEVTKIYSAKITSIRACTVKTLWPDTCSSWIGG